MSPNMRFWLATLAKDYARGASVFAPATSGIYNPRLAELRTFLALERRGWVRLRSVDDGAAINGYQITETGRSALLATPQDTP
jgi:hypothetical protein